MEILSTYATDSLKTETMDTIDKINDLLDSLGMSQTDLANAIGESSKTVHRWLTGKTKKPIPNVLALMRIARVLRVPLEFLLDEELRDPRHASLSFEDQALLQLFHAIGEEKFFKPTTGMTTEEAENFNYRLYLITLNNEYLELLVRKMSETTNSRVVAATELAAHKAVAPSVLKAIREGLAGGASSPSESALSAAPPPEPKRGVTVSPAMQQILEEGQKAVEAKKKGKSGRKSG